MQELSQLYNGDGSPTERSMIFEDETFSLPELPPSMDDYQLCDLIGSGATGTVFRLVQKKEALRA